MSHLFIILFMLFCHVIADYNLQGILASMKQKSWWEKNGYIDDVYKYDYLVALFMHSFSWSFMIMLPLAIHYKFNIDLDFYIAIFVNTAIHSIIDTLKANDKVISLLLDQFVHLLQICFTFMILIV